MTDSANDERPELPPLRGFTVKFPDSTPDTYVEAHFFDMSAYDKGVAANFQVYRHGVGLFAGKVITASIRVFARVEEVAEVDILVNQSKLRH